MIKIIAFLQKPKPLKPLKSLFLLTSRSQKIFKYKIFSISIFCALISFIATSSVRIIQPFYLKYTLDFSPAKTELLMTAYLIFRNHNSYGFWVGLFQSPNTSLIIPTVEKSKLGIAGSVNALTRNLGMSIGTAISTAILYSKMSSKAGYHISSYVLEKDYLFIYAAR